MNHTAIPLRRDHRSPNNGHSSPCEEDDLFDELADKIATLPPDERRWLLRRLDRQDETTA